MRVVVIGSGLMGVSTAWFLAKDGLDVTVLERADSAAQGASFANAGMLTPSMADPWNAPGTLMQMLRWIGNEDAPLLLRPRALPSLLGWGLSFLANSRPQRYRDNMERNLRLALYSLTVMRELRAALPLSYDQRTVGTLKVFHTPRAMDEAVQCCTQLVPLGLQMRTLDARQLSLFEPALADVSASLAGGIHFPEDESGDARQFTEALARHAQAAGAIFRFGATVTGFERDGARVTAVSVGAERLPADAVVLAAGSWSPLLLRPLGLRLAVRPVKGYSVTLPLAGWKQPPALPIIDDALHAAVTPLGQCLRVAGTAEFAGYDTAPTPARIDNLFKLLLTIFPAFKAYLDETRAAPWAGLRPVSADGVPFIGQLGYDNLYVNTGHGHLGWTLAAGSARMLADLIQQRTPMLDPVPYRAQRGLLSDRRRN